MPPPKNLLKYGLCVVAGAITWNIAVQSQRYIVPGSGGGHLSPLALEDAVVKLRQENEELRKRLEEGKRSEPFSVARNGNIRDDERLLPQVAEARKDESGARQVVAVVDGYRVRQEGNRLMFSGLAGQEGFSFSPATRSFGPPHEPAISSSSASEVVASFGGYRVQEQGGRFLLTDANGKPSLVLDPEKGATSALLGKYEVREENGKLVFNDPQNPESSGSFKLDPENRAIQASSAVYLRDEARLLNTQEIPQGTVSKSASEPVKISFKNDLGTPLVLAWADYSGQLVHYGTVNPGESHQQGTFATHPWVILNQEGKILDIVTPTPADQGAEFIYQTKATKQSSPIPAN
jgi:hypothetical protein